ncbi:hypothetical protein [Wolbachia endosymbiont (group A) of Cydia strobilella]|uniref:hypothetical protein n=1 Tax=Wolbachia endosymbiont (group A) of Cydia strobilella TaxID=3066170 RepID=UPI003133367C
MEEDFEVKEQTSVTEIDNWSYEDVNENSEDLQPVYEVGTVLLISSIALYIMKIHIISGSWLVLGLVI